MPLQEVIVEWDWEWKDPEEVVTHVSETSYGDGSGERGEEEDSDVTCCSTPDKEHTVTFKCIGTTHDLHAQEVLKCVSEQLHNGNVVPVSIFPEPSNQYDSKAIAFKCWINGDWHRIGYIVSEALDAVHDALDNNLITSTDFAWAKYMISWTRSGPGYYAGINITKYREWPAEVCRCSSTR